MKGGTLILLLLLSGIAGIALITGVAWWYLRYADQAVPPSVVEVEQDTTQQRVNEADIARVQRAVAPTGLIAMNIERFRVGMGRYPLDLNELVSRPADLDTGARWDGPYINNPKLLVDPWDQEIRYTCPGTHNTKTYDLWTVGFDGIDGTSDDAGNW